MKKYFLSVLIIVSTFLSVPQFILATTNSGFIPGQIWYSKEALVEGDTVNIHTAVWNGEKNPISAKVEFYDKNVILGSRDVTLSPLELKDVYIPWKITTGDHIISAKIISSTVTISGKKERIVVGRTTTSNDKQFVSVLIKNEKGELVEEESTIQTQLENAGSKINEYLPEKVSASISSGFNVVENFREEKSVQVALAKDTTQKEINILKSAEGKSDKTSVQNVNIEDATEKPITYIKLFLLSVLSFILSNKIVFYGILIFIAFLILRFIYRRIRNT